MSTKASATRSREKTETVKSNVAELKVRRLPITDLKPHPRNEEIRKHPEKGSAAWDTLKASLQHDYFDPVVWNVRNGLLVSGHLRCKVLADMGVTAVDAVEVDYDEPTHMARMLAANRTIGIDDRKGVVTFETELARLEGFNLAALASTPFEELKIKGLVDEPDFEFEGDEAGENEFGDAFTGGEGDFVDSSEEAIRYCQLIYSQEQHKEFMNACDAIRKRHRDAIPRTDPDDDLLSVPDIVLHAIKELLKDLDSE